MKRIITLGISLSIGLALTPALSTGCSQPRIDCTTGHASGIGAFAMKYTLKPGSKTGEGSCDTVKGEIVGLEKYNPASADDPNKQDLTKATLAIRATTLGQLAADAEAAGVMVNRDKLDSLGDFVSTVPDESDVCTVPTLSAAEGDFPSFDGQPETRVQYEWKDVRLLVTTAYPGTQVVAEVTYTRDGCSATYSAVGLWPAVYCEEVDAEGKGTGKPDVTWCDPVANPEAGRAYGSGINPDFKDNVDCDPDLLLCVLKEPPPALR
jgi:hypothetical protein